MKTGIELITEERKRQVTEEGWSTDHDFVHHRNDELARAAVAYALPRRFRNLLKSGGRNIFPFGPEWWKPAQLPVTIKGRIRELVKAGALIAAEIDRLNRSL